jgi:murein DD-endopeptidase MepM/ murein hydrolase activator NlpD
MQLAVLRQQLEDLRRSDAVKGQQLEFLRRQMGGPELAGPNSWAPGVTFSGASYAQETDQAPAPPGNLGESPLDQAIRELQQQQQPGVPGESPLETRRPVRGDEVRITSGFGFRYHPLLKEPRMHAGIDWAAPPGSLVIAAAGGLAVSATVSAELGNTVLIDHPSARRLLRTAARCERRGAVFRDSRHCHNSAIGPTWN